MAWTAADVKAYASELSAVPDATVDYWSAEAATEIDERVFADLYRRAGINLTAHLLIMSGAGTAYGVPVPGSGAGGSGVVTGMTVGQVSVTYSAPSGVSAGTASARGALGATRFGTEYLRLLHLRAGGPWLADVGD